jgi:hypothetical protein
MTGAASGVGTKLHFPFQKVARFLETEFSKASDFQLSTDRRDEDHPSMSSDHDPVLSVRSTGQDLIDHGVHDVVRLVHPGDQVLWIRVNFLAHIHLHPYSCLPLLHPPQNLTRTIDDLSEAGKDKCYQRSE